MKKSAPYTIIICMLLSLISTPIRGGAGSRDIPTVLLPISDSPLVTFRIQFMVGSMHDPPGKKGLTALTADLVTHGGTKKRSYDKIVDLFYPMATSVQFLTDKEVTTVIATVHRDNVDAFYDLMMEMLLEPGFAEDDFERIKSNHINYLEKQLRGNDDEELGKEALNVFLYENHPYGNPVYGLVADLKSITLDDVERHYRKLFSKNHLVVGLSGGYDRELLGRLLSDLSRLPESELEEVDVSRVEPIEGIEVLAVEKECRSTAISMGRPIAVTRSDEDFYPLLVANSYFGEHRTFNGVLMIRMREVRGLNYGDYSYIENFIQDGGSTFPLTNIPRRQQYFSIWIRPVQHKNRHFALRLALYELKKLVENGISKEDFELTRKFLKNYSRLWAQNQSRRLGYLLDSRFYGIDDFIATLPARLDALTVEDVNAAIRKYLDYENIKVAVVTKGAAEFLEELIENKPSPIEYDAEGMPGEVLAEDEIVARYPLHINREKSRVIDADDLFEK